MSNLKSSDEVLQEHIEVLGFDLGKLFHKLWNEFAWMQIKWQEYVDLYGTSPERIELLNSTSPRFFKLIQDVLLEDILLSLSRLTDPPKTGGKENLTFNALPAFISDVDFHNTISELVKKAVDALGFARDWRNRHIAHRDLKLAIGDEIAPLSSVTRLKVANGISFLYKILNAIYQKYFKAELSPKVFSPMNGAISLLYILQDGLNEKKARHDRIISGKQTNEDIRSMDPI